MFIDTHCHLNFKAFNDDWREVVERAKAAGVEKMIVVGADLESSQRAVEMVQDQEGLYAAVGVHPHHARAIEQGKTSISEIMKTLRELAKRPKVVAIGEVGLDYHVPRVSKYPEELLPITEDFKTIQRELFEKEIELAKEMDLPMILHGREAGEEVLQMVKDKGVRGTFHCFGGSKKYLKRIIEAGFYVGFDGDITYVPDRAQVAAAAPIDRLLLETDSPLLTPAPHRGERNEPANVSLVAEVQARVRNLSVEEIGQTTSANAIELFGL